MRKHTVFCDQGKLLIDRLHGVEGRGNRRARESFQQYRIPFTVRLNAFSRSLIDSSRTTSSGDKIRLFRALQLVDGITWPAVVLPFAVLLCSRLMLLRSQGRIKMPAELFWHLHFQIVDLMIHNTAYMVFWAYHAQIQYINTCVLRVEHLFGRSYNLSFSWFNVVPL